MTIPITKIDRKALNSALLSLGEVGGTTDHTDWMRDRENAGLLIKFINEQRSLEVKNPDEMTVEAQLTALRRANDEERWELSKDDFTRLASSAPPWPKGYSAYRSFRIRFGYDKTGVNLTFQRHHQRIMRIFGSNDYMIRDLLSKSYPGDYLYPRLRLLSGDHTHSPVVQWIVADLDTHRQRESITAARELKSLADELLVIAWMFPGMIRAIDCKQRPGLIAAGYELDNYKGFGDKSWQCVVNVEGAPVNGRTDVISYEFLTNTYPHYSVPRLRESPAVGT